MSNMSNNNSNKKITEPSGEKDVSASEREKLMKDIQELKSIISEAEFKLSITKFKDVKHIVEPYEPNTRNIHKLVDLNLILQNELYKFSGFQCVKVEKSEWVFEFSSAVKNQAENTYCVQILREDKKMKLGKWIMPPSVDMDLLTSQVPISEIQNIPNFLKKCKHYVDCYSIRYDEFINLKNFTQDIKNCNVQVNLGYTLVCLDLFGIYDKRKDIYMNLTIQLIYESDQAKPHKIEIDWDNKKELDKDTYKRLKQFVKHFKTIDLQMAFERIMTRDNDDFLWEKESNDDSFLKLNDSNNSDSSNGFLSDTIRNKRLHKQQKSSSSEKSKRKKQRQKSVEDMEQEDIGQDDTEKLSEQTSQSQKRKNMTKPTKSFSRTRKKIRKEIIPAIDGVTEKHDKSVSLNAQKDKSKQLKLNFGNSENLKSKTLNSDIKFNKLLKLNAPSELATSTPLRKSIIHRDIIPACTSEISDITVNEELP